MECLLLAEMTPGICIPDSSEPVKSPSPSGFSCHPHPDKQQALLQLDEDISKEVHYISNAGKGRSRKHMTRRHEVLDCSACCGDAFPGCCSRRGRASKSNEELCHELLEFNLAMGLPENRVPSMKELCENGRFVGSIRCFVPLAL
ncbi:hypothetical protein GW17_00019838 [Ensete ventricosum]|nr:hypothetical protein GW17_00019838 [Ensete ventricosum]